MVQTRISSRARIRNVVGFFAITFMALGTWLSIIGFDEEDFVQNAGEWVHRRVPSSSSSSSSSLSSTFFWDKRYDINNSNNHNDDDVDANFDIEILDIQEWEKECIETGATVLLQDNDKDTPLHNRLSSNTKCQPPSSVVVNCSHCTGSYSSGGLVFNLAINNKCQHFYQNNHSMISLQQHAHAFLSQTMPLTSTSLNDKNYYNTQYNHNYKCDICQIIEICRQYNLTITFVGDSVQAQVFQGLLYELQRRRSMYSVKFYNNNTQSRDGFWKTKIQYRERILITTNNEWKNHDHDNNETDIDVDVVTIKFYQIYILPFEYEDEMYEIVNSGDILILGFGLHWNSNLPQFAAGVPSAYTSTMKDLLSYIHANSTTNKMVIHRETSAQHFDAPSGDYSIWYSKPQAEKNHTCQPITNYSEHLITWREKCVQEAARQSGYRYTVAGTHMPPLLKQQQQQQKKKTNKSMLDRVAFRFLPKSLTSAATSSKEITQPVPTTSTSTTTTTNTTSTITSKELVVLPFYNYTSKHYNLHPTENVADCTHYCSHPYLFQPLWRSLRIVLDRQFNQ